MNKKLLKQLTRIADALEKSNMQAKDSIKLQCLWHREASAQNASAIHTQEQTLAAYRQQLQAAHQQEQQEQQEKKRKLLTEITHMAEDEGIYD